MDHVSLYSFSIKRPLQDILFTCRGYYRQKTKRGLKLRVLTYTGCHATNSKFFLTRGLEFHFEAHRNHTCLVDELVRIVDTPVEDNQRPLNKKLNFKSTQILISS